MKMRRVDRSLQQPLRFAFTRVLRHNPAPRHLARKLSEHRSPYVVACSERWVARTSSPRAGPYAMRTGVP